MNNETLEIQPCELRFASESVLTCNAISTDGLIYKIYWQIKTTSPNKYSVRPNTGIIKPNATCDFKVTMSAHSVAPPNLKCTDKFLIQSIIVPFGTTEEGITSDMAELHGENSLSGRLQEV
ncbi:hypothetical protein FNV43_RR01958 [Rhamnella rubrinervis]|uniref:MSP domain-containing protein n=1 Tax=Rhamnella rubrinervis TaxID=2594499 RepID=A0A8K0HRE9_9ROSA|nr:hypothetical protein FNV43_RR01958 [Rhamnella rubrinervis]